MSAIERIEVSMLATGLILIAAGATQARFRYIKDRRAGRRYYWATSAIGIVCFGLCTLTACALYLLPPDAVWAMLGLQVLSAVVYAPTVAVMWSMYADAADYSEWQTGRRFTGMVFATIGFSLKSGLALGSAVFLWCLAGFFGWAIKSPIASLLS